MRESLPPLPSLLERERLAKFINLQSGEPAPWFRQRTLANESFTLDVSGGRYLVLCFFGSGADPHSQAAIAAARASKAFNDEHASFFGVSIDAADEGRLAESYPGHRHFLDFDRSASRAYGAAPIEGDGASERDLQRFYRRIWVVLDPTLRVLLVAPFQPDQSDIPSVLGMVSALPPPARFAGVELQAPVIMLPNVFDAEFCQRLIALYETHGGRESGFMREVDGRTVEVKDHRHKRRRDHMIEDAEIIGQARRLFARRVAPEIAKVHQFQATRMERYIVSCYDAAESGHFRPHRDNTTKGTAHRRFAASVNLNADFEGGELCFPEYGPRSFKPPPGAAVVFSCSLLHAVTPVTRGRRYAFLPFLYDETAAEIRSRNASFVDVGDRPSGEPADE